MKRIIYGVVLLSIPAGAACTSRAEPPAAAASVVQPTGTLAQVMRGVYFPNANLLFDVQQRDPGAPPSSAEGRRGSVTEQFSSIYTGWQVVENAAVALAESTDLITIPGRRCQNGKAVPVDQAEYAKAAQGMRQAALVALDAARAKNREQAIEATNTIADGCAACHERYRDMGDADGPERCTP